MDAKKMKVAFYVYPTAFQSPGGGEILLLKTKEYLEKEGASVTLLDPWRDKLKDFDILHTFGSVKDALPLMELAHCLGVKNVLSTVCWYSWKSAWGICADWKTRCLSVVRHAAKVLVPVFPSARKRMMYLSDLLVPNSESEAQQLQRFFCASRRKIVVVPNAVDSVFADATPDLFVKKYQLRDFILCVGRIEPRKNQLGVIRALRNVDIPLVLIGDYVVQYRSYYEACRREAGPGTHFLGNIPHDSELLRSAYAACAVFLLATWLETPGLAALEAGLAGAKVVVTAEGATREYFGPYAEYVQPECPREIRERTLAAIRKPATPLLQEHIRQNYSWPLVAKKILTAYQAMGVESRSR